MRTALLITALVGALAATPQPRPTPHPRPRPRPRPTRPPTAGPSLEARVAELERANAELRQEQRVAELERQNAKLRQTLIPAPAPETVELVRENAELPREEEPKAPVPEKPVQPPECTLATVPRKALSACVRADGFCVASPTECTELGGRYNSRGCGSGENCACCEAIPEPPTLKPTLKPTVPRPQCPLQRVARKSLSACVLADGFCVGSPEECTELGGRYDARGCGGGTDCACCEKIPTDPPVPKPTFSPEPTSEAEKEACELSSVPGEALRACIKSGGYCMANEHECGVLGGSFEATGCGPESSCGCCGDVPDDEDEEATDDATPRPTPRPGPYLRASTPAPVAREAPKHAYWWTPRPTYAPVAPPPPPRFFFYFRLVAVLLGLAALTAALPVPTSKYLLLVRWPFYQVFVCMRASVVGVCGLCFSFGDGIAESRPPKPTADVKVEMNAFARSRSDRSDGSTDSLLVDGDMNDAFADFEKDQGGDPNPFNLGAPRRR